MDGTTWVRLEIDVGQNSRLEAYGESAALINPDEDIAGAGTTVDIIEANALRSTVIPANGLVDFELTENGLFGVAAQEEGGRTPTYRGYSGIGLFFSSMP